MHFSLSDITDGPSALEKILSAKVKPLNGQQTNKLDWYKGLLTNLNNNGLAHHKNDIAASSFALGYITHQAAMYTQDPRERLSLMEDALIRYQQVSKLKKRFKEQQFFAYLVSGVLTLALERPWLEAEELFLMAYETCPSRGESMGEIINHYLGTQEWAIAYIFTMYGKDHYFNHPPAENKWGVDHEFYNWRVLDLHTAVCYNLGKMEEAFETFSILLARTETHPQLFGPGQIDKIREKQGLFAGPPPEQA